MKHKTTRLVVDGDAQAVVDMLPVQAGFLKMWAAVCQPMLDQFLESPPPFDADGITIVHGDNFNAWLEDYENLLDEPGIKGKPARLFACACAYVGLLNEFGVVEELYNVTHADLGADLGADLER